MAKNARRGYIDIPSYFLCNFTSSQQKCGKSRAIRAMVFKRSCELARAILGRVFIVAYIYWLYCCCYYSLSLKSQLQWDLGSGSYSHFLYNVLLSESFCQIVRGSSISKTICASSCLISRRMSSITNTVIPWYAISDHIRVHSIEAVKGDQASGAATECGASNFALWP